MGAVNFCRIVQLTVTYLDSCPLTDSHVLRI